MEVIIRKRRHLSLLLGLGAMLLSLFGCTRESGGESSVPTFRVELRLRPPASYDTYASPSSRASRLSSSEETELSSIDILVFSGESGKYLYHTSGVLSSAVESGGESSRTVSADMQLTSSGSTVDLWILANVRAKISDLSLELEGLTQDEVRKLLTFSESDGVTQRGSVSVPIPMWGELLGVEVSSEGLSTAQSVPLLRMVARIDVVLTSACEYELESVWLCNRLPVGMLVPDKGLLSPTGSGGWNADYPSLPLSYESVPVDEDDYYLVPESDRGTGLLGTIYAFESPARSSAALTVADQLRLVIGLRVGDDVVTFPVDFQRNKGSAFMPLLRNHLYEVRIGSARVSGGSKTAEDAAKSEEADASLEASVVSWDEVEVIYTD